MQDATTFVKFSPAGCSTAVTERGFYDVAFNRQMQNPDWTIHRLTPGRALKKFNRDGTPIEKLALLLPFKRDAETGSALPVEYAASGYDMGHMVPCEAMQFDLTALRESFLTSNICPQSPGLNRGPWKALESHCFEAARSGRELVIITGPYWASSKPAKLASGVSIPDAFWKVVIEPSTERMACYIMANAEHVEANIGLHYVPLYRVAHLTQFGFPALATFKDDPQLLDAKPQLLKLDIGNSLQVEDLTTGEYVLLAPFLYNPCDARFPKARIRIKPGFVTDFGSTGAARGIYPSIGTFRDQSFVGHDGMYASNYFQWLEAYKLIADSSACRAECDWRLLESLQAAGDTWFNRNAIWSAVKLGGGSVWDKHTPESIAAARTLIETVEVAA